MKAVTDFLEERTALVSMWRKFADHPVPGGPAVKGILPAILVYLFAQQAIIGILLALHYSPSATDAWASTVYLNDQLAAGWFLRGLHLHGTSVMVVAILLYLVQLAVTGMYKRPREFVWISALLLLLVVMGLGVTGNVLPWDEQGYWSIQVELGIAEQTPGGEALRTVIQGGGDSGNLLLTRMYTIHAFLLPGAGVALLAGIVVLGRRAQVAEAKDSAKTQAFFPSQAFINVVAMALVAGVLVAMTVKTHGSELFAPADPTSGFQARPEWYFLPLFKLRMFFEGPLEPIATMLIPGAVGSFVVVAPFIDAKMGPGGRKLVLGALGFIMASIVALTALSIVSDAKNESLQEAMKTAYEDAERSRALAREGVPPKGGPAVWENDPAFKVKALFKEHCANCHTVEGRGGTEAPDLTDYGSRAWLTALVRNPQDPRFFGGTKHETMDPYPVADVPDEQMAAMVEYLVQLSGGKADAELAAAGKTALVDDLDCNGCHEVEAGADNEGPNLVGRGSLAWVVRVIGDPSQADLFGTESTMPKFESKLSKEEIEQLAQYVVAQNGDAPAPAAE
ncbi:MAG: cytochrome b N-terminal domain-containing protein [Myxococcota bacterium]